MRSTYAAAMTITFMGAWNNYLWPKLIMTNGQTLTMPMLTANMKNVYVVSYDDVRRSPQHIAYNYYLLLAPKELYRRNFESLWGDKYYCLILRHLLPTNI